MKVVIVGGVAGGASTAARLRRLDEEVDITMYEKSGYISYANCGLPYFIGGIIEDKEELTLQTPKSFYDRFNINAKVNHEVIDVDVVNKKVLVKNLITGEEFFDSYDKLVLSPGAKAIRPNIPGIDNEKIFTLRTVEDTLRIHDYIEKTNSKSAIVIGGGFVGLEAAENLKHLGMEVTLVEAAPQVLAILDEDMAAQVHGLFRENGIKLILGKGISAFEQENEKVAGIFADGERISADLIMLAIGVVPDSVLAQKAGLETGIKGSIVVNDKMETSVNDIYAVGDAVEITYFVTEKKALISLAGPANKQGRIAADNIAGGNSRYKGTQGSSVIKLFDMTAGATGINERQAKVAGIEYEKVILSPPSHASYYPGGKTMMIKMLFEKNSNEILGAQIVGFDGVDKRIDVIATAMRAGMKAVDLAELELAYAPPYSSAKDPVNMAGFIAENIASGKVKQFYYEDIPELLKDENAFLLDVHSAAEFQRGHAEGFSNISVDELRNRVDELPKDKAIYIMCRSGIRSYVACRMLANLGFDCFNFAGGYRYYSMVEHEKRINTQSYTCGMDKEN